MNKDNADDIINRIRAIKDAKWYANREWDKQLEELNERLLVVLNG